MRLALIFLWLAVALVVVLPLLRRARVSAARARPLPDELVKDPVCQTYVVKSKAVTRADAGEVRYFCSAECARRSAGR